MFHAKRLAKVVADPCTAGTPGWLVTHSRKQELGKVRDSARSWLRSRDSYHAPAAQRHAAGHRARQSRRLLRVAARPSRHGRESALQGRGLSTEDHVQRQVPIGALGPACRAAAASDQCGARKEAPEVVFVVDEQHPIPWHPHIYTNGIICLDLLSSSGWSPVHNVESVCVSLQSMLTGNDKRERPDGNDYFVRNNQLRPRDIRFEFHDDDV